MRLPVYVNLWESQICPNKYNKTVSGGADSPLSYILLLSLGAH